MSNFSIKRKSESDKKKELEWQQAMYADFKKRKKSSDNNFKNAIRKKYGIILNHKDLKFLKNTVFSKIENELLQYINEQRKILCTILYKGCEITIYGQVISIYSDRSYNDYNEILLYSSLTDEDYTFKVLKYLKTQ